MAAQKKERSSSSSRERRRSEERASLASASTAFSSGLDLVAKAVTSLSRASRALDAAAKASSSPEMARYGLAARLRPEAVRRAVTDISRDLSGRLARAKASGLVVPDGQEDPYLKLLNRLSVASEAIEAALRDFGDSLPSRPGAASPPTRDLILTSARASAHLNRLLGRRRSAASVHVAAVSDEISSTKDVSFY